MKKASNTFICLLIFSSITNASNNEVTFRCKAKTIENCEKKVINELNYQKCELWENSVICQEEPLDKGAIYCSANTNKCTDSSSDGFTGVTCQQGKEVSIKDRKLSATWAKTIFWIWDRSMCIDP